MVTHTSTRSSRSAVLHESSSTAEQTPLLASDDMSDYEREYAEHTLATTSLLPSAVSRKSSGTTEQTLLMASDDRSEYGREGAQHTPATASLLQLAASQKSRRATEQTPLLASDDSSEYEQEDVEQTPATASLLRSLSGSRPSRSGKAKVPAWKQRWPSILALVVLVVVVVSIMLGILATQDLEEYAMQAADFQPTKLSLDGLTDHGAKVHIQGDFRMDASRVHKKSVRNIGRFGTWIAREVEAGPMDVNVFLPDYGNVLIGKAKVPSIKLNIRNGHTTHVSFTTNLEPGSPDGIRNVANDWIEGRLGQIRLRGRAEVPLRSGLISIGKQIVEQAMVVKGKSSFTCTTNGHGG